MPKGPVFFGSPAALRRWFARHAGSEAELVVGYMKRSTGVSSLTWPESVDEALCVGWIDGVRRRIDGERYQIRFTPRKARSSWSNINIARVKFLRAKGRMRPAGLAAFAARDKAQPPRGSYEQTKAVKLPPKDTKAIRANPKAWKYFQTLPPGYVRLISWWIISAKRPETRAKRLGAVIDKCAAGKRFTW
ncbi:MAG TPA: YdeI/OmpD-associated family protein [Steroidobacteraceae bacterium]|nr:YdeI/OmpD-associated family protein [Steroidobacteraceae bacterium]